jgi:hypothetical protein
MQMLKGLWERWKAFAQLVGNFQARLLLGLFYFLVLSPFALGVKLFSDPLAIKSRNRPGWIPRGLERGGPADLARRQF